MDISGKTRIYRKDFDGKPVYSTSISRKNQDGKYENMYIQIQLPKDIVLEDKTDINITKGFISWYKTKDGLSKIKFVIMEYETEEKYIQEEREAIQNENSYNLIDELENDLLFDKKV